MTILQLLVRVHSNGSFCIFLKHKMIQTVSKMAWEFHIKLNITLLLDSEVTLLHVCHRAMRTSLLEFQWNKYPAVARMPQSCHHCPREMRTYDHVVYVHTVALWKATKSWNQLAMVWVLSVSQKLMYWWVCPSWWERKC